VEAAWRLGLRGPGRALAPPRTVAGLAAGVRPCSGWQSWAAGSWLRLGHRLLYRVQGPGPKPGAGSPHLEQRGVSRPLVRESSARCLARRRGYFQNRPAPAPHGASGPAACSLTPSAGYLWAQGGAPLGVWRWRVCAGDRRQPRAGGAGGEDPRRAAVLREAWTRREARRGPAAADGCPHPRRGAQRQGQPRGPAGSGVGPPAAAVPLCRQHRELRTPFLRRRWNACPRWASCPRRKPSDCPPPTTSCAA